MDYIIPQNHMKKLGIGFLIASFVLTGMTMGITSAKADTIGDLTDLVQSLQQQVTSLRSQLSGNVIAGVQSAVGQQAPSQVAADAAASTVVQSGNPYLVSYWWGKVNQHTDPATGKWMTDSDGVSGANLDMLAYCQKFYPNTSNVAPYQNVTLNWFDRGNVQNQSNIAAYTATQMAYQCVQGGQSVDTTALQTNTQTTTNLPVPSSATVAPSANAQVAPTAPLPPVATSPAVATGVSASSTATTSTSAMQTAPIAAMAPSIPLTRPLAIGSAGADVLSLQQYLNANGYLDTLPSGYYGKATAAAVAKLQSDNGLPAVGTVGMLTRSFFNKNGMKKAPEGPQTPPQQGPQMPPQVQSGTVTVAVNPAYVNTTIAPNTTHAKIGSYTITNNTTETVQLLNLKVGATFTTVSGTDFTNLSGYSNTTLIAPAYTGNLSAQPVNLGVNATYIASNQSMVVDLYADFGSATSGTITTTLAPLAYGQTTHTGYSPTAATGQTITIGNVMTSGTLIVTENSAYPNTTANANTAGVKIGSYTLQNQNMNDSFKVNTLTVSLGGNLPLTDISNLVLKTNNIVLGTPIGNPTATNNFPIGSSLIIPAGQTVVVDVYADLGSTTTGYVTTSMSGTAQDLTSFANDNLGPVTGQTITISVCTLNAPTLINSQTTTSQYIAVGNNGATNATEATYNFVMTGCSGTITSMKFKQAATSMSTTSVKVGNVTAPFVNDVAYLTGLNIAVSTNYAGTNVPVYVSYPGVGTGGIPSGSFSTIALSYVQYTAGNMTATCVPYTSCIVNGGLPANPMVLVASKPTVTISQSTSTLAVGNVETIDVTVAADSQGNIKLNSIPVNFATTNATLSSSANAIIVRDSSNNIVNTTSTPITNGGSVITFPGWGIPAGSSVTFKISVPVTTVTGAPGTADVVSALASNTGFSWTDIAGNATVPQTGVTYMYNYPTTTSIVHN